MRFAKLVRQPQRTPIRLRKHLIGVPTPRTPQFNQLATAVARAYDQISANGAKPATVVPDLAKRVDKLLQDS